MMPFAEVIGDPVAQSKSPAIHRFWLDRLGIAAEYRATQVAAEDLAGFLLARAEDPAWRGCNVTMPLKQAIMSRIGQIEPPAARIGAVNTVTRRDDGLFTGANTDAEGFLEPLRPLLAESHWYRMARVLGTGGAARTIVHALAAEGFTIVLAGRDTAKAQSLLAELAPGKEHHAVDMARFAKATDFPFDDREGCLDLVVNASPLGMRGQPPLRFDWSHAPPRSIAYDIVTDPVETEFLRQARASGLRTIDGLQMLIGQAARAFEMFFGASAPREHDAELRARLMA
jgi:shikimate dehydrogenase